MSVRLAQIPRSHPVNTVLKAQLFDFIIQVAPRAGHQWRPRCAPTTPRRLMRFAGGFGSTPGHLLFCHIYINTHQQHETWAMQKRLRCVSIPSRSSLVGSTLYRTGGFCAVRLHGEYVHSGTKTGRIRLKLTRREHYRNSAYGTILLAANSIAIILTR